jgi:hypothetical protein
MALAPYWFRAGVDIAGLLRRGGEEAIARLPEVHGQDRVRVGRRVWSRVLLMPSWQKKSR